MLEIAEFSHDPAEAQQMLMVGLSWIENTRLLHVLEAEYALEYPCLDTDTSHVSDWDILRGSEHFSLGGIPECRRCSAEPLHNLYRALHMQPCMRDEASHAGHVFRDPFILKPDSASKTGLIHGWSSLPRCQESPLVSSLGCKFCCTCCSSIGIVYGVIYNGGHAVQCRSSPLRFKML